MSVLDTAVFEELKKKGVSIDNFNVFEAVRAAAAFDIVPGKVVQGLYWGKVHPDRMDDKYNSLGCVDHAWIEDNGTIYDIGRWYLETRMPYTFISGAGNKDYDVAVNSLRQALNPDTENYDPEDTQWPLPPPELMPLFLNVLGSLKGQETICSKQLWKVCVQDVEVLREYWKPLKEYLEGLEMLAFIPINAYEYLTSDEG